MGENLAGAADVFASPNGANLCQIDLYVFRYPMWYLSVSILVIISYPCLDLLASLEDSTA